MEEKSENTNSPKQCFFCQSNISKYCCPRCNEQYCSLECYRSESHAECSESFYRECVTQEMTGYHVDDESRNKMQDILMKLRSEDLQDPEELAEEVGDGDYEDIDSDDEEYVALQERLAAVDLEDSEAVWSALTADERMEFEALVSGGQVGELVEPWIPWWNYSSHSKLVEEVKSCSEEELALKKCPVILSVPELPSISKTKPAECVKYDIMNVIASYAFTVRYFNGETSGREFVAYLLSVCGSLGKNRNYDDLQLAVGCVEQECVNSTIIETDKSSLQVMKSDVYLILKGPSKEHKLYYCQSVLSDVHRLLVEAKKFKKGTQTTKNAEKSEFSKRFPVPSEEHLPEIDLSKIKNNIKKIEYYLAYLKSYGLPDVI